MREGLFVQPVESKYDDAALQPQETVENRPSTSLQRALLDQWLTGGYLMIFAGLAVGMLISSGVPAVPFALVGLIMMAPLLLAMASTALGRYRLAALWSAAGAALATLYALMFLYGPLDSYPLLEQLMRSTEGAICSILLALAARSMLRVTRTLWNAPPQPPRLGAAQTTRLRLPAGAPANDPLDVPGNGWRIQHTLA
jgi:hypothetical protein